MSRPANVDHYLATKGSSCAYCQNGRHHGRAKPPEECGDCAYRAERDKPYMGLIPVWREGHVPTKAENAAAFRDIAAILRAAPDCYYDEYEDGVTGTKPAPKGDA